MSHRYYAVALVMGGLLGGCVSTHGLHTTGTLTDPSTLKASQSFADIPLSSTAWPKEDWWVGLGDPQLSGLIEEALRDNPSLEQAASRARQAQAAADGINGTRQPQVNLSAELIGADLSKKDALYPEYTLGSFGWYKAAGMNLSWDADLWGGRRAAWESALGRTRAAQVDAHAARIQLSVNVARAYVRLGYGFAQQDVADSELQRTQKSLDLIRRLVAAGLGTRQQENLADSQVASAEGLKVQAARAIDAARSSLSTLVGQGPDRGLAIGRPHLVDSTALALPDNLAAMLIGRRADLVAARWQIEAQSHAIKATHAEFLPNVSLSAMAGLVVLGPENLFQSAAGTYSAGPALTLPIFDGGRLRAKLTSDDAAYDQLVARYNGLLVAAVNQVADNVSDLESVRSELTLVSRAHDDALKSWQDAISAYRGGVTGPLTPLIARQQLLLVEQRKAVLDSELTDASIRLIEALGGGYDAATVKTAQLR